MADKIKLAIDFSLAVFLAISGCLCCFALGFSERHLFIPAILFVFMLFESLIYIWTGKEEYTSRWYEYLLGISALIFMALLPESKGFITFATLFILVYVKEEKEENMGLATLIPAILWYGAFYLSSVTN